LSELHSSLNQSAKLSKHYDRNLTVERFHTTLNTFVPQDCTVNTNGATTRHPKHQYVNENIGMTTGSAV